jgi:hypothetical protein
LFHLVLESPDGRAAGADSEEKHEPVSDIDTVVVDSLKALDPEWPIREADIATAVVVCPLCAISGLTHRSKKAPLFGHLVGIRGTGFMERG